MAGPHVNRIKEIGEVLYVRPSTNTNTYNATNSATNNARSPEDGDRGAAGGGDGEAGSGAGEGGMSLDEEDGDMCAVCLSELSGKVKTLPCKHTFHAAW